jgi:hypothetical protein
MSNCSIEFINILFLKCFKSNFLAYRSRHNDLAYLIRENFQNNISNLDLHNMTQYTLKPTTPSHTDITRLRQGQVGGQVCFYFLLK